MIDRIALVLALSVLVVAAYYALRFLHLRRMKPTAQDAGIPALLYFRSDSCAVCPAQGRIIDQLAAQWGGRLRIERIDAEREPEVASRYRVFTLPTTVLVDDDGRIQQVNYGLTDGRKLSRQLTELVGQQYSAVSGSGSTAIESA
jgi:thioredoxin-like negative regulator of GroEL